MMRVEMTFAPAAAARPLGRKQFGSLIDKANELVPRLKSQAFGM
jgi:hypothetical protein